MPDDKTQPYTLTDFDTASAFLDAVGARPHIRLIKVDDQGLVGPARRGSAIVMQPMVRVVATAFDHHKEEILRWEHTHDVGRDVVTLNVGGDANGRHRDPTGARTRDELTRLAELRSLTVSRGEWTPNAIRRAFTERSAPRPVG